MGFFNDLTKKTSETTSKIAKKTSETTSKIAKETKLRMKISDTKGKIDDIYEEIGKNVYENYLNKKDDLDKIIKENCEKIDDLSNIIKEARDEILVLRNRKTCVKCSEEIDAECNFCPKCGAKQPPRPVEEPKEEEVVEEEPKEEKPKATKPKAAKPKTAKPKTEPKKAKK